MKWFWHKKNDPGDGFYTPKERLIYQYFDGKQTVQADPMVLYKKVMDVGAELAIEIKVAMSPSKDARKSQDALVRKVRAIFGIQPIEMNGLTEIESLDLLDHFLTYCSSIKKNSALWPTMRLPIQGPSTSTSNGSLPTISTSDSGSTENGSGTDKPEQSPTEQLPLST